MQQDPFRSAERGKQTLYLEPRAIESDMKILATEFDRIIDCFKVISWKLFRGAISRRILNLVLVNISEENVREEKAIGFQNLNPPNG